MNRLDDANYKSQNQGSLSEGGQFKKTVSKHSIDI